MAGVKKVLVIGLDPHRVPGPWDPEPVARAIRTGLEALAGDGYDTEACLVGLDGSDDIATRVAAALRAQHWDCVVVGGGIRKEEDLLELFETIINLIRSEAPDSRIAFNSTPENLLESVRRRISRA
jgi:hypothetical protein